MVKFARNKEKNNGRNKCKCQFFQGVGACFAPKTLSGAAVPVLIGIASAVCMYGWDGIRVVPAVLCMLFALVMQVDANFVNDYLTL